MLSVELVGGVLVVAQLEVGTRAGVVRGRSSERSRDHGRPLQRCQKSQGEQSRPECDDDGTADRPEREVKLSPRELRARDDLQIDGQFVGVRRPRNDRSEERRVGKECRL